MSKVIQPSIEIPEKYLKGLVTGKYIREGSVIRDQQGKFVKFLKEVDNSNNKDNIVNTVTSNNTVKNTLIGIGVVVGISTVALGIYSSYQKHKKEKQEINQQDGITNGFNVSLNNYINAIKEGNLSLDILEDLIWNINFIKENSENKEIKVTFTLQQLEELVNLIYNYTIQLAKVNNIDYTSIKKEKENSLSNIIYYLDFQKEIFKRQNAS